MSFDLFRIHSPVHHFMKPTDNRILLSTMTETNLTPLLELPSNGSDVGYPGFLWHDGLLWVSYNSSHEGRTSVYLAKIKVSAKP